MKTAAICLILVSLVGCVTQEKKAIDTAVSTQLNKKAVTAKSTCSSNLVIVEDGRLAGDSAGVALGIDASMSTAPALLSAELGRAGVVIAKTADADTTVVLVKRVYLSQTLDAKQVNIVLEVRAPGLPPKIIRTAETSIMWWGSFEESEKAMAKVFKNTVVQLVGHLNASCNRT